MITTPGLATTPVTAAQSQSHSTTHFASVNTFQALDNVMTDDKLTDLLSAPDLHEESTDLLSPPAPPVDLTPLVFGNVLTCALQRLDEKWTTILTTYSNAQDAQRC